MVNEFVLRNPDVVLDPEKPIAGRVLVNVNRLVARRSARIRADVLVAEVQTGWPGWDTVHLLFVVPARDIASRNDKLKDDGPAPLDLAVEVTAVSMMGQA